MFPLNSGHVSKPKNLPDCKQSPICPVAVHIASGGIRGAIAQTADEVFQNQLTTQRDQANGRALPLFPQNKDNPYGLIKFFQVYGALVESVRRGVGM